MQSINIQDANGNTCLHLSARNKSPDNMVIASKLIKYKADLIIKNNNGDTPLDVAIKSTKTIEGCSDDLVNLIKATLTLHK